MGTSTHKCSLQSRLLYVGLLILTSIAPHIGYSQETRSEAEPRSALELESKLQAVVDKVRPSVVLLRWPEKNRTPTTGVIFDKSGLILTHCHHDQKPGQELNVFLPDGRNEAATLETVFDTRNGPEWSLIRINALGPWPASSLQLIGAPSEGEPCFQMGYPAVTTRDDQLLSSVLRVGQVAAVTDSHVYADCPAVPGDSGGPLLNLQGEIVGIAKAVVGGTTTAWSRVPQVSSHQALRVLAVTRKDLTDLRLLGDNKKPSEPNRGIPSPFSRAMQPLRQSIVEVVVDGKTVAMGMVVRPSVIATKRSEILLHNGKPFGDIYCRLPSDKKIRAEVIADSHEHDVALIRIADGSLPPLKIAHDDGHPQGRLVSALVALHTEPIVGTVSTLSTFTVKPHAGAVGAFDVIPAASGVRVDVGSDLAGPESEENPLDWYSFSDGKLTHGDVITHVNGSAVNNKESWAAATGKLIAGDLVELKIRRGRGANKLVFPSGASYWRALDSAGPLSHRRTGFPEVLGHDALIRAEQCGSPVIDSRGNVIGMNIARYHTHQTLAIPSKALVALISKLLNHK